MMDYVSLISAVTSTIRTATGFPVVVQGSNDETPPYPYCAYTVTSPYLAMTSFEEANQLTEDVEIVFSLTWHDKDHVKAMELTQKSAAAFKKASTRQKLSDKGLSVVRLNGFGNRDTFLTIDVERRYGFDLRLRTRYIETDESTEVIEEIVQ